MNAVDGSEHYERQSDEPSPSLLAIILDTNPRAWSALSDILPLSRAIANILVFINAHLAFNYANKVAVIASHSQTAQWLYPAPSTRGHDGAAVRSHAGNTNGEDVERTDGTPRTETQHPTKQSTMGKGTSVNGTTDSPLPNQESGITADDANKYRPFRLIEDEVMRNLRALIDHTSESTVAHTNSSMMAGALTLALAYINKQTLLQADESSGILNSASAAVTSASAGTDTKDDGSGLQSRILVISVSSDLAFQYIPVMNCIFAAQRKVLSRPFHLRIPIDVLKLQTPSTFLQQAADATHGVYTTPTAPHGLLQYLMMAYLPDQSARQHLVLPTQVDVDFRAACFCHKRVVDTGFVCSICLSIFCEPPPAAVCLTCGTHLALGDYGAKPAVVPRKKKKRKKGAIAGTPGPSTPGQE